MKPLLSWVRSNVVAVVCLAVAIIALPALLFLSSRMNAKLVEEVRSEVSASSRSLQQIDVTYSVESPDPSIPSLQISRAPNKATTDAVRSMIELLKQESDGVLAAAIERNSEGKRLLMDGFFPEPPRASALDMRRRFGELWYAAHSALLREVGADMPQDPPTVEATVRRAMEQRREQMLAGRAEGDLNPDERDQLTAEMRDLRLDIYRNRAIDLRFYAPPSVFAHVTPADPTQPVTPVQAWDMQHRLWVHEDVLRALQLANSDSSAGWPLSAAEGPVKRLESLSVEPWPLDTVPSAPVPGPVTAPIPLNFDVSPTGRDAWPASPNALFDIRYADVHLVVASDQIPRVVEAIHSVNLMTVVSMQVSAIDQRAELEAGYFFGDSHVVRLTLRIETIWLRQWMAQWMPDPVKRALGVPGAQEQPGDAQQGFDQF